MESQLVVIAYDTPDAKRRRRLAKAAIELADRVQKSLYEGWYPVAQRAILWDRLAAVADADVDQLRCYWLCERCRRQSVAMGTPAPRKTPQYWLF